MKTLKIIVLLIGLLFLIGCQCEQTKVEAENIEKVKAAWAAWNEHDLDFFYDFYDNDEYKYYTPFNAESESFEELMERMPKTWGNYPDLSLNIEKIFASGDMVVTMMLIKGTHTEEIENLPPPQNKKLEVSCINIVRFVDGKVVDEWEVVEMWSWLKQLGYELKEIE